MNNQRIQAYFSLISRLLACSDSEQFSILKDNKELLDEGLFQSLSQAEIQLKKSGNKHGANTIERLREQIVITSQSLGINFSIGSSARDYEQFIERILQAINISGVDPVVIYPLLQGNIDKLDENLIRALKNWVRSELSGKAFHRKREVASNILDFGRTIHTFPLGNRAINVEISLAIYNLLLTVFTPDSDLTNWAMVHLNLGTAYRDRIYGDKADNMEQAIASSTMASEVFKREDYSVQWGMTQHNLGIAYRERIRGKQPENLEQAIAFLEKALQVFTREKYPVLWAQTQSNLGGTYSNRILGAYSENLEVAIATLKNALTILTPESQPVLWAQTQNNLGEAYRKRTLGEKSENIELAISALTQAFRVFTRDTFPTEWAIAMNNLGSAYSQRIAGDDRSNNIETALNSFTEALQVCSRESNPVLWAALQNNVGIAYSERIVGDKADNMGKSLAAYNSSAQVRTRESNSVTWAETQTNLGIAYCERIYGDRKRDIEKAIAIYNEVLQVYTLEKFPDKWAEVQNGLGNAYLSRVAGDKANNIEKAIRAFKAALTIHTRESNSLRWAAIQNGLGTAYTHRISLNRAEAIENAIAAFKQALTIRTRESDPHSWAVTQRRLGEAYSYRVSGDKTENMEQAITAIEKALQVHKRESDAFSWAIDRAYLGQVYINRIVGNRAENLETAIAMLKEALPLFARENDPITWADIQNNLGEAYRNRLSGDRVENQEMAIAAYKEALEVVTLESRPVQWAAVQNNLGIVYAARLSGYKSENLERAIDAFDKALQIRTRSANPTDWAKTQMNLGIAYFYRVRGDRTKNLEKAIITYKNALSVFATESPSLEQAMVQNNLGIVYVHRKAGDRKENLEMAINAFKRSFQVYKRETMPIHWAETQLNLGSAYHGKVSDGDRTDESVGKAINAYEQVLAVFTPETDAIKCFEAFQNLGNLYFVLHRWEEAVEANTHAMNVAELSRSLTTTDEHRQAILSKAIGVYQKQVQAYIQLGRRDKATEIIERSKARNLVELLTNRDIYPKGEVSQEVVTRLDRLRRDIPALERQRRAITDALFKVTGERSPQSLQLEASQQQINQALQTAQQQMNEVLDEVKVVDPSFSLTQTVETIQFDEIQALVDERTAIIQWYFTGEGILTSVITQHGLPMMSIHDSKQDKENFSRWLAKYTDAYAHHKDQWKSNLATYLVELAKILRIDEALGSLDRAFNEKGFECDRLILIPHRILHLLPLHALPLQTEELLCDHFSKGCSYAPSIQLLQLGKRSNQRPLKYFFSIENPTEDLSFADLEVSTIRKFFAPDVKVLAGREAKKSAFTTEQFSQADVVHFSCHSYFNFDTPSQSALMLAGSKTESAIPSADTTVQESIDLEKCLTLGDIFALDLRQCSLTTLSACETGLTDFTSLSDEYIGLPSGFLFAGSPNVVSSLWTVNDASTAFLTIQFYRNLKCSNQNYNVAMALSQAQRWLRQITKKELKIWINENQLALSPTLKMSLNRRLQKMADGDRPFELPFHWAAFCAIG